MIQMIAFALIALVLILFLKDAHPAYAAVAAAVAGGMLLTTLILTLYEPLQQLLSMMSECGVKSELISYLLKAFGICYLAKFAAELCNDFGQTAMAGKIDFAGRVTVFILTLPLIQSVLQLALSMM